MSYLPSPKLAVLESNPLPTGLNTKLKWLTTLRDLVAEEARKIALDDLAADSSDSCSSLESNGSVIIHDEHKKRKKTPKKHRRRKRKRKKRKKRNNEEEKEQHIVPSLVTTDLLMMSSSADSTDGSTPNVNINQYDSNAVIVDGDDSDMKEEYVSSSDMNNNGAACFFNGNLSPKSEMERLLKTNKSKKGNVKRHSCGSGAVLNRDRRTMSRDESQRRKYMSMEYVEGLNAMIDEIEEQQIASSGRFGSNTPIVNQ